MTFTPNSPGAPIIDRQRALAGRSPITASLHHATPLDTVIDTIGTTTGDPLARVLEREQLALLASAIGQLTPDQRTGCDGTGLRMR